MLPTLKQTFKCDKIYQSGGSLAMHEATSSSLTGIQHLTVLFSLSSIQLLLLTILVNATQLEEKVSRFIFVDLRTLILLWCRWLAAGGQAINTYQNRGYMGT